jgi:hypothetical protein
VGEKEQKIPEECGEEGIGLGEVRSTDRRRR